MASTTYAVEHPLAPPTISGNALTVDLALQNPTVVTRRIMDLTLQKFIADRVFSSAGGVTGGAVVYDQATLNDLYLDRDVAGIDPGGEYPIVSATRPAPLVANVEKWGGKFFITDEARDRNSVALFNNQVTKLANTIVRKLNQRAIQELETSITASGQTGAGHNWGTALTTSLTTSTPATLPFADIIDAQATADAQELGVVFDTLLVNPAQAAVLKKLTNMPLNQGITDIGINEVFASNRVPAATAYLVARQQVGEMRMEQPLATETWREQGTDRNWLKSGVRPVMYVTDPYSVFKLTGLAG
jgi:hypothetical protein